MSDEHWAVDNGVDAAAALAGSRLPSRHMDDVLVGAERWADEACWSHIARVLGSTGQLEAETSAFAVASDDAGRWEEAAGVDVDDGSAGASAFHHPILCRLELLQCHPQISSCVFPPSLNRPTG